ncbi:metallophosphoesterase family protein [Thermodesulfobacteriota bacterium]
MRIGLISDTHIPEARQELWPQVFTAFRGVDAILHAGDIHHPAVIRQLSSVAATYAVRGNGEEGSGGRHVYPCLKSLPEARLLEFEGLLLGITHAIPMPEDFPPQTVHGAMHRYFGRTDLDALIYGDTHVEAIDVVGKTLCVNPGSPTFPHNLMTQLGTIGFLEVRGGRFEAGIWQLTEHGIVPFGWGERDPNRNGRASRR